MVDKPTRRKPKPQQRALRKPTARRFKALARVEPHDITVIAPAFYPNDYYIRYFKKSAEIHQVPYVAYGVGQDFRGWIHTHIDAALEEVARVTTPYVMFVDASDSVWLKGLEEVAYEYSEIGAPEFVMGVEKDGLNAGGWIGSREGAAKMLGKAREISEDGNPQVRFRQLYAEGAVVPTLDKKSRIFRIGKLGRTQSCVWHCAGGYTDPVYGKREIIEPVWKALGYPDVEAPQ